MRSTARAVLFVAAATLAGAAAHAETAWVKDELRLNLRSGPTLEYRIKGFIKSTPRVTGFVGGTDDPPAISESEVREITQQMEEGGVKPKVLFEVGESVRVTEGPFTDFNGNVEEVNYEKSKIRVSVLIFGRATPVELDFGQVEKA